MTGRGAPGVGGTGFALARGAPASRAARAALRGRPAPRATPCPRRPARSPLPSRRLGGLRPTAVWSRTPVPGRPIHPCA